jgi:hypothetical protein
MPSQFQQGCFNKTIEAETELSAYSPFVSQTVKAQWGLDHQLLTQGIPQLGEAQLVST